MQLKLMKNSGNNGDKNKLLFQDPWPPVQKSQPKIPVMGISFRFFAQETGRNSWP